MRISFKRILALAVAFILLLSLADILCFADNDKTDNTLTAQDNEWNLVSYDIWYAGVSESKYGKETVKVDAGGFLLKDNGEYTANVKLTEGGLYGLKIGYTAIVGESLFSSPIQISVSVNGKIPYREASSLTLSRVFESVSSDFERDEAGNDIQPEQKEVTPELVYILSDASGYHSSGLYLPFITGTNTITIKSLRSDIKINYIEVAPIEEILTYEDYLKKFEKAEQNNRNSDAIYFEAEKIYRKSDCTIVPASDRSSASVTPNSACSMLLNTVGSSFSKVGQWISWKIDIKESGFYKISMYAKQSVNSGAVSTRKLYIDGVVPFKEAEKLVFPFNENYENYVLSSGEKELLFYLNKGEHEIALEAVLGDVAECLNTVSAALNDLNDDYIRILFYTGSDPDVYREYGFEKLIPDVIDDFANKSKQLYDVSNEIKRLSKGKGSSTAMLDKLADLLFKMSEDTDEITKNFSQFKNSLSSLGTWLNEYKSQPLQIDSVSIAPENIKGYVKKDDFFKSFWFKFKIFLSTFTSDYTENKDNAKNVNVWIATGRDQSKIIDRLAKNDASKTGIHANVSLINGDALLPNILAGSEIDVYLNAGAADPINYAIRGAVLDLTQFDDFNEISTRFNKAALIPFTYKGAVYALPESLDFSLLFYRKDIFDKMDLSVPKTWDDFYETVAVLQKNNLTVGVNWLEMFNLMLYQSGGSYYNADNNASALDEFVSIDSFAKTLKFYKEYGLPVEFNFINRFRSGDMPMGIVSYMTYNQLYLFAPEISGMWEFTSVPGIQDQNGNINNNVVASGTGAVILKTTKDKNTAWEFLKWWTDTDTQINYGIEMEKVMGDAARQSSANLSVVSGFPWSVDEYKVISEQWDNLSAIPQIPGSYYVSRTLDFAFNSAYSLDADPSRVLIDNVEELNIEITRKIQEFENN